MREVLKRREIQYRPSSEIERAAQEEAANRRRLLAFYARRSGTQVLKRHWYLFHKRPDQGCCE